MERQWNVSGNAGNVDDRAASLLLHDRYNRLHAFECAEQVRVENLAHVGHGDAVERSQDTPARVVDPDVDSLEMMKREPNGSIDFFTMPDIASQGHGLAQKANSCPRRLGTARIA